MRVDFFFHTLISVLILAAVASAQDYQIRLLDAFDLLDDEPRIDLQQPVKSWAGQTADLQISFSQNLVEPKIRFIFSADFKPQVYRQVLYKAKSKKGKSLGKWYDILVPLYADQYGFFAENSRQKRTRNEESYWWVDFHIGEDVVPGQYPIKFKLYDGSQFIEDGSIKFEILTAPKKISPFLISLNEYGDKYLNPYEDKLKGYNLWQIEKSYYRFAREHHAVLNALPYKGQSGMPRKGMTPVIKSLSAEQAEFDWKNFDQRYGDYFTGMAFEDGAPLEHFYLPFNPEFPAKYQMFESDRKQYDAVWQAMARAYIDHFRQKKWTATDFYVYLNQKPAKNNAVRTNFDEPKSMNDFKMLNTFHTLFESAFSNTDPLRILFRLDISHFYCDKHRGHQGKDFRVNGGFDLLKDIDVWAISNHALKSDVAMDHALDLINHGRQVWHYGSTPQIGQRPESIFREVLRDRAYELTGTMVWKSMNRDMDKGTGKDFIFYQGQRWGIAGPLPSKRLKWLRDAAQVAERLLPEDLRIGKCYNKISDADSRDELFNKILNAKNGILKCVN